MQTLDLIFKARLRESSYPFLDPAQASGALGGAGTGGQAVGTR